MSDDIATVKRPALSKRLRYEILRRDAHTCRYCGASAPDVKLVIDHVVPVALGGTNDETNLVTACSNCNGGKGSSAPNERIVSEVSGQALRAAQALEVVTRQRRAAITNQAGAIDEFDAAWRYWRCDGDKIVPRDEEWRSSIATFAKNGMTGPELAAFVQIAMRAKSSLDGKWRYFCGCCWNEIRNRETLAAEMVQRRTVPDIYADPNCPICLGFGIAMDGTGSQCSCVEVG